MTTGIVFVAVLGASLWTGGGLVPVERQLAAAPQVAVRPNIVLVLLDDLDSKAMEYMTQSKALIADQGIVFSNYMFNLAQCCPSRATMLRGQYSHNTHVYDNGAEDGGFKQFYTRGSESSTLATWLHDENYTTAYMGKYLNGYPVSADLPKTHIPVGWDRWYGFIHKASSQYNYEANDNGTIVDGGDAPQDYATDVLAGMATEFVADQEDSPDPFLLLVAPTAPHKPYTPAPRDANLFPDVTYPRSPSYNEADVSDKPGEVRGLPLLTNKQDEEVDEAFRDRVRSVQAVDEMIAALVAQIDAQGKLDNTVFMVASDNGLHMGEHRMRGNEDNSDGDAGGRIPGGKSSPYLEDVRVPLFMRGPGISAGQVSTALVGNVDIAPTMAQYAQVPIPDFVDGRSFAPLAAGMDTDWRNSYLIERWPQRIQYYGIYTDEYSYVRYDTGEREIYDLVHDPYQLDNLYGTPDAPSSLVDELETRARDLSTCAGEECRAIDGHPI
jgi:N-acetylglucosamine-6-sulfatase